MKSSDFYKCIAGNNINFLIGSGMSTPLYQTLSLPNNPSFSFEDVLTHKQLNENARLILYLYYYLTIIERTIEPINLESILKTASTELTNQDKVVYNYLRFIDWARSYLANAGVEQPKRINIFTTNYDLLFEYTFDYILKDSPLLWFNDGSRGYFNRIINSENYNINISHSGFNDSYRRELSLINLYKLHGSVLWQYSDDKRYIQLDEQFSLFNHISQNIDESISEFAKEVLLDLSVTDLDSYITKLNNKVDFEVLLCLDVNRLQDFYTLYKQIPIVSPNKVKFEETVFNQYYYQLLRSFSYELEKKQTTLIVFGFSFADEHIRSIVNRSLLNPELQVYIIPYSRNSYDIMSKYFRGYNNIHFLPDFGKEPIMNSIKGDFDYLLNLLEEE